MGVVSRGACAVEWTQSSQIRNSIVEGCHRSSNRSQESYKSNDRRVGEVEREEALVERWRVRGERLDTDSSSKRSSIVDEIFRYGR